MPTLRILPLNQYQKRNWHVVRKHRTSNKTKLEYEIRWYRYELGIQSADEYSGVYWEKVDDGNNNPFDYTLLPRKKHN